MTAPEHVTGRQPVCPACGSQRVAAIVYGMPSVKAKQDYAAGRTVLGGMRELPDSPRWLCRDCEHRFLSAS